MTDRYGRDVLAADPHAAGRPTVAEVEAASGLVVECIESGWCGAVVGTDKGPDGWAVVLEDRHGTRRPFAPICSACSASDWARPSRSKPPVGVPSLAKKKAGVWFR